MYVMVSFVRSYIQFGGAMWSILIIRQFKIDILSEMLHSACAVVPPSCHNAPRLVSGLGPLRNSRFVYPQLFHDRGKRVCVFDMKLVRTSLPSSMNILSILQCRFVLCLASQIYKYTKQSGFYINGVTITLEKLHFRSTNLHQGVFKDKKRFDKLQH